MTLIIVAAVITVTLVLNAFKIGDVGVRTLQWILLAACLILIVFEFLTPFAKITANYIIISEYTFFIKKILFHNIRRVKVLNKRRMLAVFTMEEKKYIINLKAINYKDKEEFIKLLEDIVRENLKLKSEKTNRLRNESYNIVLN
ncbi:MAG: hypothetical protein PHD97_02710 [Bacteroidales bacterium]|nr:hypothetical protein [Bacteroidales bacterium]